MKFKNKVLSVFGVTVVTVGMAAGAAYAAGPFYVGGGTWYHNDVGASPVYSNYFHGSRCHTATVINGYGVRYASGPTRAGVWARASAPQTIRPDNVYWNNRC